MKGVERYLKNLGETAGEIMDIFVNKIQPGKYIIFYA